MPDIRKKLVVVGDGACGKTCMLIVHSKGIFPKKYVPTVFENYTMVAQYGKSQVELSLWDTAGQEDYDRLRPLSYPESNVVLMCYSVDSMSSLDNLTEKWYPELTHFLEHAPKIVVGLKIDLRDEASEEEKGQYVSYERGAQVAASLHCKYYECSAKSGKGLQEVFQGALKAAMQSNFSKMRKRACAFM
ncbi:GTP-binding protein Rho1 [Lunasporangiospora selenospora]|uniref:GTP-binding protein Rho1 n=1 Tax=Lunasporangiospora selenospora TaxID=979761 RepID=A0A9P6FZL9_9FUNG|nr:GTP-binding protein Rho1 [Lunasporangiospora selenospora]